MKTEQKIDLERVRIAFACVVLILFTLGILFPAFGLLMAIVGGFSYSLVHRVFADKLRKITRPLVSLGTVYFFVTLFLAQAQYQKTHPDTREADRHIDGELSSLPIGLQKDFEGCSGKTRPVFRLIDGFYSALCLEDGIGATGQFVKWWQTTGKKSAEEYYFRGTRVGTAKHWDEKGRLVELEEIGDDGLVKSYVSYDYEPNKHFVAKYRAGHEISRSESTIPPR